MMLILCKQVLNQSDAFAIFTSQWFSTNPCLFDTLPLQQKVNPIIWACRSDMIHDRPNYDLLQHFSVTRDKCLIQQHLLIGISDYILNSCHASNQLKTFLSKPLLVVDVRVEIHSKQKNVSYKIISSNTIRCLTTKMQGIQIN